MGTKKGKYTGAAIETKVRRQVKVQKYKQTAKGQATEQELQRAREVAGLVDAEGKPKPRGEYYEAARAEQKVDRLARCIHRNVEMEPAALEQTPFCPVYTDVARRNDPRAIDKETRIKYADVKRTRQEFFDRVPPAEVGDTWTRLAKHLRADMLEKVGLEMEVSFLRWSYARGESPEVRNDRCEALQKDYGKHWKPKDLLVMGSAYAILLYSETQRGGGKESRAAPRLADRIRNKEMASTDVFGGEKPALAQSRRSNPKPGGREWERRGNVGVRARSMPERKLWEVESESSEIGEEDEAMSRRKARFATRHPDRAADEGWIEQKRGMKRRRASSTVTSAARPAKKPRK